MTTLIGILVIAAAIAGVVYLRKKDKSKNAQPGVPVSNVPTDVQGDGAVDPINRQGKQPGQE